MGWDRGASRECRCSMVLAGCSFPHIAFRCTGNAAQCGINSIKYKMRVIQSTIVRLECCEKYYSGRIEGVEEEDPRTWTMTRSCPVTVAAPLDMLRLSCTPPWSSR
jgi:hypothetical protein